MKTQLIATTLFTLAAMAAGPAAAQYMKPGLWQFQTTTPGTGNGTMAAYLANMKKEMANMSPEARKQMEAVLSQMAARDMGITADGFHTKVCITKEEVQDLDNLVGKHGNCTTQRSPLVGGQLKMNMSCTNPPATGSAVVKFQGDTGYTMEATMTGNMGGQPATYITTTTGKWLASDCGKVKPATASR